MAIQLLVSPKLFAPCGLHNINPVTLVFERDAAEAYMNIEVFKKTDTSEIVNDVIGEIDEFFDGAVNFVKSQFAKMLDNMKAK